MEKTILSLNRIVPPLTRRWHEVLPAPFNTGHPVVAFEFPLDWEIREAETKDHKYQVYAVISADKERCFGLQVVDVELSKLSDHREVFRHYDTEMLDPVYIGPLQNLPNDLLMDERTTVMIFMRDEFWRRPVDLKRAWIPARFKC